MHQSPRWWFLCHQAHLRHQVASTKRLQSWALGHSWNLSGWCLVAWLCIAKDMELGMNQGDKNYILDKVYYLGLENLLRSQNLSLKNHQKIKSRVRRRQDWHKDRTRTAKVANPKKGIQMKRCTHPVHKAEPARQEVQTNILVVMTHRAFSGFGG